MSTLVNPFHTEHNSSDVIGYDNNTAMLLANSKTITDDVTLTLPYVSFEIFSPGTNLVPRASVSFAHVVGETEGSGSSNYRMSVNH